MGTRDWLLTPTEPCCPRAWKQEQSSSSLPCCVAATRWVPIILSVHAVIPALISKHTALPPSHQTATVFSHPQSILSYTLKITVKARDNLGPGLQTHALLSGDDDSTPCYWFHVCFICEPCQVWAVSHSFPCPAWCKLLSCNLWQQNNCKKQTRCLLGKREAHLGLQGILLVEHAINNLFNFHLPKSRSVSKLIPYIPRWHPSRSGLWFGASVVHMALRWENLGWEKHLQSCSLQEVLGAVWNASSCF